MELTFAQISHVCQNASSVLLTSLLLPLNHSFILAEVTSEKRAAMYVAQTAHESKEFTRMEENLDYSLDGLLKTWPKRFTLTMAQEYARKSVKIANHVYANRNGNGDEEGGDGFKYRGRGAIGLTFAANYQDCGKFLGIDLLGNPDLASSPQYCFEVAAWYWRSHGLNAFADTGDLEGCTKKINGGLTGIDQRRLYYTRAMEAFAAPTLLT